jgi:hypothetical protein
MNMRGMAINLSEGNAEITTRRVGFTVTLKDEHIINISGAFITEVLDIFMSPASMPKSTKSCHLETRPTLPSNDSENLKFWKYFFLLFSSKTVICCGLCVAVSLIATWVFPGF